MKQVALTIGLVLSISWQVLANDAKPEGTRPSRARRVISVALFGCGAAFASIPWAAINYSQNRHFELRLQTVGEIEQLRAESYVNLSVDTYRIGRSRFKKVLARIVGNRRQLILHLDGDFLVRRWLAGEGLEEREMESLLVYTRFMAKAGEAFNTPLKAAIQQSLTKGKPVEFQLPFQNRERGIWHVQARVEAQDREDKEISVSVSIVQRLLP